MLRMRYAVGVDIGGTFTDFVLADLASGRLHRLKKLTTVSDPSRGVIDGILHLASERTIRVADIGYIVHATTLITNAIIERKGPLTGLITTAGMRDVLEIGRESRYDLYDLYLDKCDPLVPRRLRMEVRERIRSDGSIHSPLDTADLLLTTDRMLKAGVRSIAMCFINSYRNPAHESAAKAVVLQHAPNVDVSISSEVSRESGEYERTVTVVANAYVKPIVREYLNNLTARLKSLGFCGRFEIMLSDGGVCSAETAIQLPIRIVDSGPAAGVRAATFLSRQLGLSGILSFDMGGTTAKITFIDNAEPATSTLLEVSRVDRAREGSGLPLQIPSVELLEIGAGGGSIASVDGMGLLKVGPESAGADPGPAAYGRGGKDPTITDANLLLGALSTVVFGFGELKLDVTAASRAVTDLAAKLKISEHETAAGIYGLINEHMVTATRLYAAERAKDLGNYTMVAYGGAGPVHAYEMARILGLKRILYPWGAGTLSALGLLVSPRSMSASRSSPVELDDISGPAIAKLFAELDDECYSRIKSTGVARTDCVSTRSVTMRYVGQGYELRVPLSDAIRRSGYPSDQVRAAFDEVYGRVFGRSLDGLPIQFVTWHVTMTAPPAIGEAVIRDATESSRRSPATTRKVFYREANAFMPARILAWADAQPGDAIEGPVVFESEDSTVVIGPRGVVTVDPFRNLLVDLRPAP